jgi:hypothetical protein
LPPLPPLLPLLLCQNVGGNGDNDNNNASNKEFMMGGLCVLVVRVVSAGCVCCAPLLFW